LIINELYTLKIKEANVKEFVERTYHNTFDAQLYYEKDILDKNRRKILDREH
jgi:hypothetical protein